MQPEVFFCTVRYKEPFFSHLFGGATLRERFLLRRLASPSLCLVFCCGWRCNRALHAAGFRGGVVVALTGGGAGKRPGADPLEFC